MADSPDPPDDRKRISPVMVFAIVQVVALALLAVPIYRALTSSAEQQVAEQVRPPSKADRYGDTQVDPSRDVTVHLTAHVQDELPWEFEVETPSVTVHPGERTLVKFHAKNTADQAIDGKAIYDITPPDAGEYFKKLECFCFSQQTLKAGEQAEMPVQFWLDPDLPSSIDEVTVNYEFFNMKSSVRGTAQR